jgi:hypothetical protein
MGIVDTVGKENQDIPGNRERAQVGIPGYPGIVDIRELMDKVDTVGYPGIRDTQELMGCQDIPGNLGTVDKVEFQDTVGE